jgi:hypothetical protein
VRKGAKPPGKEGVTSENVFIFEQGSHALPVIAASHEVLCLSKNLLNLVPFSPDHYSPPRGPAGKVRHSQPSLMLRDNLRIPQVVDTDFSRDMLIGEWTQKFTLRGSLKWANR